MNSLEELQHVLKQDDRFVNETGDLIKASIASAASQVDASLISLLLDSPTLKKTFFTEVEEVLVFDKSKFNWVVNNKEFLPDSYTAYKNKVGLSTNDHDLLTEAGETTLVWPYKDTVLEGGQTKEDQERDEIFYNETLAPEQVRKLLAPKAFTNGKRYTETGEEEVGEITDKDNLIIKGNNLLALSSLLERYREKVKLIFIDPPFNTDNDGFRYNDKFTRSTWLTFMKNRLVVAKQLLSDEGLIFIELDKNEDAYLKVLMDEIFGEENYVNNIAVQSSTASGNKTAHKDKTIIKTKDTILVYKKERISLEPQYTEQEYWDTHFNSILIQDENGEFAVESLREHLINNNVIDKEDRIDRNSINNAQMMEYCFNHRNQIFTTKSSIPSNIKKISRENPGQVISYNSAEGSQQYALNGRRLGFLANNIKVIDGEEKISKLLADIWTDIDFNNTQNEGGVSFPSGKKPEKLLKRIIDMTTKPGDLVLDFYMGSGTTAAVSHKMNRRYISIEQMDYIHTLAIPRLQNVINGEQSGVSRIIGWQGGGEFVYLELKERSQSLIRKLKDTTTTEEIIAIYEEAKEKSWLIPNIELEKFEDHSLFKNFTIKQQQDAVLKAIDKNKLYINASEIEDGELDLSDEEKVLTRNFYKKGEESIVEQRTLPV